MEVERQSPPMLVPSSALIFNSGGTQVAVIGPDERIQLRAVDVPGDFDSDIGIATGVCRDENVVINPGDRMSDGVHVEVEQDQTLESVKGASGKPRR